MVWPAPEKIKECLESRPAEGLDVQGQAFRIKIGRIQVSGCPPFHEIYGGHVLHIPSLTREAHHTEGTGEGLPLLLPKGKTREGWVKGFHIPVHHLGRFLRVDRNHHHPNFGLDGWWQVFQGFPEFCEHQGAHVGTAHITHIEQGDVLHPGQIHPGCVFHREPVRRGGGARPEKDAHPPQGKTCHGTTMKVPGR